MSCLFFCLFENVALLSWHLFDFLNEVTTDGVPNYFPFHLLVLKEGTNAYKHKKKIGRKNQYNYRKTQRSAAEVRLLNKWEIFVYKTVQMKKVVKVPSLKEMNTSSSAQK